MPLLKPTKSLMEMWEHFASDTIYLGEDEVHIWKKSSVVSKNEKNILYENLTRKEKERAAKFRFEKDRMHFITARSSLRFLLRKYLGLKQQEDIQLEFGKHGKPFFKHKSSLQFNVSHSGEIVLLAFTRKAPIGIDIEYVQRKIEFIDIGKRFFSNSEVHDLLSLPEEELRNGFFNCWTRKEAFIKAVGDGLSFPLNQFSVTLKPNEEAQLYHTNWNEDEKKHWTLKAFSPQQNYTAAVALKEKIKYWKFFEL